MSWRVSADDACERLDIFLVQKCPDLSRSAAQRLIKGGECQINARSVSPKTAVQPGDFVTLSQAHRAHDSKLNPQSVELDILFEDEDMLVVNKPPGLVVHPGAGTREPTLIEGILYYLNRAASHLPGPELRPGIVHRLDRDTSGCLVIAKTDQALRELSRQFRDKTNLREYVALLNGVMSQPMIEVESYLHRDPRHRLRYTSSSLENYAQASASGADTTSWRYAKSSFLRQRVYGERLTLAAIRLATGRTHQIRVHAKQLGLPVIGDPLYGSVFQKRQDFPASLTQQLRRFDRQLLHARLLGVSHPRDGREIAFEAPMPSDFREFLQKLEKSGETR